jgi:2-dehydro-3-deoxyphosphogluconate aldolase / (4S)-4-hydroxy-2-oxoglutarate aldolase
MHCAPDHAKGRAEGAAWVKKHEVRGWIEEIGVVPAIRVYSAEDALFSADALFRGGIPIVEIAMTVPGASKVISHLVQNYPQMVVGAGSVLDKETARICLDAGALFITSDGLYPELLEFVVKEGAVVIPGALTPTEVTAAWKVGCDFVKVVPCAEVGGVTYIRSLHKMFPHIPLIAAGGVSQQNATNFILAGAVAVGIGGELIPGDAIRLRQADRIGELSRRFIGFVKSARVEVAAKTRKAMTS